jgi:hypothetical protein
MFPPWSASPMAESSWVRWSRSASIRSATAWTAATTAAPSSPVRGVGRRVEQLLQLVVDRAHRDRRAGHVQRGHVVADPRVVGLEAALAEQLL